MEYDKSILDNPSKYNLFYGFDNNCEYVLKHPRYMDYFENDECHGLIERNEPDLLDVCLNVIRDLRKRIHWLLYIELKK